MPKMKKTKPTTFDPQAIVAEKLAWAKKVSLEAYKCAAYYKMPQAERDAIARLWSTGSSGSTIEEQQREHLSSDDGKQVMAQLKAEIGGAA